MFKQILNYINNIIYNIMISFAYFQQHDTVIFASNILKCYIYGIVYEPSIKLDWINIYWFDNVYRTKEYYFCNTFDSISNFLNHVSICCEQKSITPSVLFVYKHNNVYIFKVLSRSSLSIAGDVVGRNCKNHDIYPHNVRVNWREEVNILFKSIKCDKSNLRFISIEYRHPGLKVPINIILPNNYYVVGNNLLSELFIKRYLDYNHGNIFNHNYTISVLDNNCKLIKLTKGLSIEVLPTKFEIVSL